MKEERFATSVRGELHFAESQEVAHAQSADVQVVALEGAELEQEVLASQLLLQEAEELGDPRLIEKAEKRLSEAVLRLEEWQECGESETSNLSYMSLTVALTKLTGDDNDKTLDEERVRQRVADFEVFLNYVFQDGFSNPEQAFRNFLAMARRITPQHLDMTGQDLADLLDEEKATESARGIRVVDDKLEQWEFLGCAGYGGTRGHEARENSRQAARGNTNRRTGGKKARTRSTGGVSAASSILDS